MLGKRSAGRARGKARRACSSDNSGTNPRCLTLGQDKWDEESAGLKGGKCENNDESCRISFHFVRDSDVVEPALRAVHVVLLPLTAPKIHLTILNPL